MLHQGDSSDAESHPPIQTKCMEKWLIMLLDSSGLGDVDSEVYKPQSFVLGLLKALAQEQEPKFLFRLGATPSTVQGTFLTLHWEHPFRWGLENHMACQGLNAGQLGTGQVPSQSIFFGLSCLTFPLLSPII